MRPRFTIFMFVLMLAGFSVQPVFASTTYFIYDAYGGTWSDADKTSSNTDDDLMCWAAAASNVLAWSGWGDTVGDADDIFSYFQTYWSDDGGNSYYGWYWWFTGRNLTQGDYYDDLGWSQVEKSGGGDFYTFGDFALNYYGGTYNRQTQSYVYSSAWDDI